MRSRSAASFSLTQAHEKIGVLQPAAVILLEQVAQDGAARRHIGIDADEAGARVVGLDAGLGEQAADVVGAARMDLPALDRLEAPVPGAHDRR